MGKKQKLTAEDRRFLAEEAKKRQQHSQIHLRKITTVEVPALIPEDLPKLPLLQEDFRFIENLLAVSDSSDRIKLWRIYQDSLKYFRKRLLEFEQKEVQDHGVSEGHEKRLHLYREREKEEKV